MRRRDVLGAMATTLMPLTAGRAMPPALRLDGHESAKRISIRDEGWITDVEGIKVGHYTAKERPTGCTVILCENGATCGVHVPGGWPGTRLTDMLDPVKRADDSVRVSGVVLTGGSVYGLSSASGVERFMRERYVASQPSGIVPKPQVFVVPAAVIYDLSLGDWRVAPTAESGYQACQAAAGGKVAEGCVGAGAGAMVGHWGRNPTKSGLGTASIHVGNTGVVVGAICAVNASGDVYDPGTGAFVSGSRDKEGTRFPLPSTAFAPASVWSLRLRVHTPPLPPLLPTLALPKQKPPKSHRWPLQGLPAPSIPLGARAMVIRCLLYPQEHWRHTFPTVLLVPLPLKPWSRPYCAR